MGERLRALGGKLEHQDLNPGLRLTATLPLKPQGAR
jgi:hypothetical protein